MATLQQAVVDESVLIAEGDGWVRTMPAWPGFRLGTTVTGAVSARPRRTFRGYVSATVGCAVCQAEGARSAELGVTKPVPRYRAARSWEVDTAWLS